jgi:hypothetical protein
MSRRFIGALIVALLALPPVRHALERVMVTHMLVQIPLLAIAGALAATSLSPQWRTRIALWNADGISGMTMALIASTWWMVPRALDWTLASPFMETAKFASLPLFVGAPVALSWSRLGGMGRGLVIANVLPMWAVVGWLYIAAPVRVCNFYLVDQQVVAGTGLVAVATALSLVAGATAFRRAR